MTTVEFPLKPDQAPVKFRFTIPHTRAMELAAGCGIDTLRLRGQSIYAICLLACYALKASDKTMTEDKAASLIETYRESGGDMKALYDALVQALNESGVYGEVKKDDGDEPDPTKTTQTTETTPTT